MITLMCTSIHLDHFTCGQVYYVYDGNFETGCFVTDDDDENHYLSTEFLVKNFEEV